MSDAQQFQAYRPLMFAIAYRMLGSATEAEDILQEAYLRYQTIPVEQIVSHKAFLSTIVTRLCLNQLQSAREQRETYFGPWLAEPLLTDSGATPVERAEIHESLALAFIKLLEQLTPLERAIFLLRDVFDYDYAEIAAIFEREESACRQLFSRAKKHIVAARPRFKPTAAVHRAMLETFMQAVNEGEIDGLMQLLTDDVVLWADGGGRVPGNLAHALHGRLAVARTALGTARRFTEPIRVEIGNVNYQPALIVWVGQAHVEVRAVIFIEMNQDRIVEILVVGNPDKLKWLNRAYSLR